METTRLTVTTEEAGQRADSLLARRLEGLTRSAAARLLEEASSRGAHRHSRSVR